MCLQGGKPQKYDPNQSWQSDMLQVAFLAHVNRQCHVVLKQC